VTGTQSTGATRRCQFCARRGGDCAPILCARCGIVRCPSNQPYGRGLCVVCRPHPEVERVLTEEVDARVREAIEDAAQRERERGWVE
jgi:hypothetical protein